MSRSTVEIQFEVNGQSLGRSYMPFHPTDAHAEVQWSYSIYCQKCGDIWAKARVVNPPPKHQWHAVSACCPKCPTNGIPGSLWIWFLPSLVKALPHKALERELLLHCDYWEKTGNRLVSL